MICLAIKSRNYYVQRETVVISKLRSKKKRNCVGCWLLFFYLFSEDGNAAKRGYSVVWSIIFLNVGPKCRF